MYKLGNNTINGIKYPQNVMVMTNQGLNITVRMVGDDQVFAYGVLENFVQSDGTPFSSIEEFIAFWNLNFNVVSAGDVSTVGGESLPEVDGVPVLPVQILGGGSSISFSGTHRSPNDFTATYTSASTLTLSAASGFSLSSLLSSQIVGVKIVPITGDAIVYQNGSDGYTFRISGGILTAYKDGSVTSIFVSTDVYEVVINSQDKAFSPDLNAIITAPLKEVNPDVETLVTSQDLTTSYADFGAEIEIQDYSKLGIWVIADVNTSEDCDLQVLGKHTSAGTDEYEIDGVSVKRLWSGVSIDFKKYYEFEVGAVSYIQLQAKVGTLGTAGDLTISITKIK